MTGTPPEGEETGTSEPENTPKGPSVSYLPPKGIPEAPIQEESRFQSLTRHALTWLIILLVGALLGALAVYWLAYRPLRSQSDVTNQELTQTQQQSTDLQTRVGQLSSLETKNQDLQNQLKQDQILISLLSAQVDVSAARLALANKDTQTAQASLTHMGGTLKSLKGLLPVDQQSTISDMQNRLQLVTGELTSNTFAADSDLIVLAKSLSDLTSKYPNHP